MRMVFDDMTFAKVRSLILEEDLRVIFWPLDFPLVFFFFRESFNLWKRAFLESFSSSFVVRSENHHSSRLSRSISKVAQGWQKSAKTKKSPLSTFKEVLKKSRIFGNPFEAEPRAFATEFRESRNEKNSWFICFLTMRRNWIFWVSLEKSLQSQEKSFS